MTVNLGILAPVISTLSATATSVTITWTQPEFSLPVTDYSITVTLRSTQTLCLSYKEQDQTTTTQPDNMSIILIGLQEFSNYRVTITANFNQFGYTCLGSAASMDFTTTSAGMYKSY